jgi:hypothetical protein
MEKCAMITPPSKYVPLKATIMLLSLLGAFPVLADEPTVVEQKETADTLSALLKDILGDTNRNFARYYGPDDCSTDQFYLSSAELLGKYAQAPAEHQAALRHYIESGKEQCNCVRAIVGKYFDILVDAVGTEMSQVPCP